MRKVIYSVLIGLGMLQAALLTTGCINDGSGYDSPQGSPELGRLSMPLVVQANGHTYRLVGAIFVSGPIYANLDLGPDQDVVSTSLPAGSYSAYLSSFYLTRDDGSGNFVAVNAQLVSPSWLDFEIFNQTTTSISFEFESDGQIVSVGSGQLNVDFRVNETAPICTLLGSDCEPDMWCAPPELTGSPLACIDAGSQAEGEPCRSPLDCSANTSCFDFGAGAVCARLCMSSEFGQPCGSSSTCAPQGVEYGVCAPDL